MGPSGLLAESFNGVHLAAVCDQGWFISLLQQLSGPFNPSPKEGCSQSSDAGWSLNPENPTSCPRISKLLRENVPPDKKSSLARSWCY